jgi:hypothetical protein
MIGVVRGFTKGARNMLQMLNIDLVLRVRTNLKLCLIESDGTKSVPANKLREEEVHFIRIEGKYPSHMVDILMKRNIGDKKLSDFEDWTITDFDDFLKGNPHV